MITLDKIAIREQLAGYARASAFIEQERMERLSHMTVEESLAIWRDLMAGWEKSPAMRKDVNRLDQWQLEGLLDIRRAFEKLAQARGLI